MPGFFIWHYGNVYIFSVIFFRVLNKLQQFFQDLFTVKAVTIPPATTAGKFVPINGKLTWLPDKSDSYIVNGYQANDIIYSIVNMIMEKVKVAPWGLYQVVNEPALKKYHSYLESKDWVNAGRMQKKAIEPLSKFNLQTGRLNELLKWPNEEDTWNELVAADAGFINIVGNNYMWANFLQSGANKGLPGELWNTPAQYMGIVATRDFPQRKTGYQLNQPFIKKFTTQEILHEKLFNPAYGASGGGLYGMSPIKAALKTLTRNNAAKKAGATQLDNNGAAGIVYVDDPLLDQAGREDQAKIVKRVWANEYSGAQNYGKIAHSGFKMGYQEVGKSLKDMALTDIEAVDLRILANVWGMPSQLLNDPENKSYNNSKEAEKALTTRGALPRLTSTRNNFNRKIQTDWGFKGVNVYADFDMSVYTELQEDQAAKWGWVKDLPMSSKGKLEMMGIDAEDDPNLDVILVNGQLLPLADVIGSMNDQQTNAVNDALNKAGLNDYLRIAK